jgi:deoxyadenosine/deoxycytidine kinase
MYLLEGNIGVGKSTFLKLLHMHCTDITVIQEPLSNWASQSYGQSLLEDFYKDPKRWAYTIETLAMITRVKDHLAIQARNIQSCIMERSVYSGHYCFAQNDYSNGFLTPLEWEVYSRWVDFLVHKNCKAPQGFVYLRACPEICFERIKRRNRKGEEAMTLEYVAQIGKWHEKFLIDKEGLATHLKKIPVLVIDANYDLLTNKELLFDCIAQVKEFMKPPRKSVQQHAAL